MSDDPTIVYKEWPESVIWQALNEFKDYMRDGAGPDELEAGLRCLDFITYKSKISDDLLMFLEAAEDEAVMRITLMRERENKNKTEETLRNEAIEVLGILQQRVRGIMQMCRNQPHTYEDISKAIQRRRGK